MRGTRLEHLCTMVRGETIAQLDVNIRGFWVEVKSDFFAMVGAGPRARPGEDGAMVGAGPRARPRGDGAMVGAGTGARPYEGHSKIFIQRQSFPRHHRSLLAPPPDTSPSPIPAHPPPSPLR